MGATAVLYGNKGRFEVNVDSKIYEEAHDAKCSVPQLLERKYGEDVDAKAHGTVFNQCLAQCNMNLTKDPATGLGAAKLRDVMDGSVSAAITKDAVPLSRILAPAALLEMVENKRYDDRASDIALFESMIAVDTTIQGNRYEQPILDLGNAEEQEISRISQLSFPNIIGKLTVAERAGSIPTYSYGLEISDQAAKELTFDQVAIYLQRMKQAQEASMLDLHIKSLVNGDKSVGQAALSHIEAKTLDAAAKGKKLTQRAYFKWLRQNRRMRTISHIWCDEDTYFKIVEREGRPTATTVYVDDAEVGAFGTRPMNFSAFEPQIFIVNDGVLETDTIVGLDSRFAIARISNSEADYQATEDLLMRRGSQMRFDHGEVTFRHDDTAWSVLKLTA